MSSVLIIFSDLYYIQWAQTKLVHRTLVLPSVLCTSLVCAHCIHRRSLVKQVKFSDARDKMDIFIEKEKDKLLQSLEL